MDFSSIDVNSYDKYTFGKCIRQQRMDKELSLRLVAGEIGVSSVFLRDVEIGNRRPPVNKNIEFVYKLIEVLNIPDNQVEYVLDMAYASQGCAKDLIEYLSGSEKARKFVRYARELEVSDDDWSFLLEQLRARKESQILKRSKH